MSKTVIYIANILSLKDKKLFSKYYNLMPNYRKAKIDKYLFNEDKMLSLGAGILLKKACIDFNIASFDENIYYNEFSKPYFNNADMYFSISHSKNMAICAISEKEVGCDIEYMKGLKEKVLSRVFCEKEILDFNATTIDGFFTLWTLKESILKKIGKGLYLNPKDIEFDKNLKVNIDKDAIFYLKKIDCYKIACAYQTDEIEVKNIDIEKIKIK